jgi:hypothetical protein
MPPDLPDLGPVARLDDTGARLSFPSRTGLWQTAARRRGAERFWVDVLA